MDAFEAELAEDRRRIIRIAPYPALWGRFDAAYTLDWRYEPFDDGTPGRLPQQPGVYAFQLGHEYPSVPQVGYVLYVGITRRPLSTRCREYLRERDSPTGRTTVRAFLGAFRGEIRFAYATVDVATVDLEQLEKDLNDALMPPYSRKDFSARVKARRNAWQ